MTNEQAINEFAAAVRCEYSNSDRYTRQELDETRAQLLKLMQPAPEPKTEPETPFGWFRMDGGKIVFAMGAWPPPEPDDTVWSPLYSRPKAVPL